MHSEFLLLKLKENPFVLAPMAGITDHAFRSFMKKRGAGIVISELVSSVGIEHASERTLSLLSFDESQRPVGLQIFGEDPEIMARGAQVIQARGADFVDLNFGCPVPKVVKKGGGSAILKDLRQLELVLKTVRRAVKIPVTIKTRIGWDSHTKNSHEVCQIAYDCGITWVALHGRTRAQGYSGDADWDYIAEVKSKSKIPVLGNGDLTTPQLTLRKLIDSGCDGVMVGRGCLKNPQLFEQAFKLWKGVGIQEGDGSNQGSMVELLLELTHYLNLYSSPHLVALQLKKFSSWYSSGFPGASSFRKRIFQLKTQEEVLNDALDFFAGLKQTHQEDTSQEEFLMGGHG